MKKLFFSLLCSTGLLFGGSTFGGEIVLGQGKSVDVSTLKAWRASAPSIAFLVSEVENDVTGEYIVIEPGKETESWISYNYKGTEAGKVEVAFVDFYIRPVADASVEPVGAFDINGAVIGFLAEEEGGRVYVAQPDDAPAIETGFEFSTGQAAFIIPMAAPEFGVQYFGTKIRLP